MMIKTKVFELSQGRYKNLSELAQTMGISVSQIYQVREGKRNISQKFIIGAMRAFPGYKLNDLFYLAPDGQVMTQPRRKLSAGSIVSSENTPKPLGAIGSRIDELANPMDTMLTTREVAQLLNLHPNAVRRWNCRGILKAYPIGPRGARRFRQQDITSLLRRNQELAGVVSFY